MYIEIYVYVCVVCRYDGLLENRTVINFGKHGARCKRQEEDRLPMMGCLCSVSSQTCLNRSQCCPECVRSRPLSDRGPLNL